MTPAEQAVKELQAELDLLGSPDVGSSNWFKIRGLSTGISTLKAMIARGDHQDPASAEKYQRACRNYFVHELGPE